MPALYVAAAHYAASGARVMRPNLGLQWVVLCALARGERDVDTARDLCYTPDGIRSARRALYRRLGARNGAHAVTLASHIGLI